DRPPASRPRHGPARAADARSGRYANGLAHGAGAALDGQPRHRRGPGPGRPPMALGGEAIDPAGSARTLQLSVGPRAASSSSTPTSPPVAAKSFGNGAPSTHLGLVTM